MVRDWIVVRKVLELAEQDKLPQALRTGDYSTRTDPISEDVMLGHIEILADAGILKGCDIHRDLAGHIVRVNVQGAFVSMAGHDLLDALRDQNVWTAMLAKARSIGVTVSWEFIKAALPIVLRDLLK